MGYVHNVAAKQESSYGEYHSKKSQVFTVHAYISVVLFTGTIKWKKTLFRTKSEQ